MARTARFAWNNLLTASSVVIAASAAATGYPASNCANPARWLYWRSSTTTGDQWIEFDLGASTSLQAFLLAHWKAHASGGTIKVQTKVNPGDAYADQGTFIQPSPNPTGVIAMWLPAPITGRFVRLYFTNVGTVSDYVEAGAVFAGLYFQPSHSLDRGYTMQLVDPSVERRAIGGQRSVVARSMYWTVTSAVLFAQPDADRVTLTTMMTTVGMRTPIFFAIDPDTPAYFVWYGHFDAPPGIEHLAVQRWGFPFSFTEDVG